MAFGGQDRFFYEKDRIPQFSSSLSSLISHLSSLLPSSRLGRRKKGEGEKEKREGVNTKRGGGRREGRNKKGAHQQELSPRRGVGTPAEQLTEVLPPGGAQRSWGGLTSAARRAPGGGARRLKGTLKIGPTLRKGNPEKV